MGLNCVEDPFNMGIFLRLKVSFKMGRFSDTQHTRPGIFILESPPLGVPPLPGGPIGDYITVQRPYIRETMHSALNL